MRYCAVYKNYNSLLHNLGVTVFVIFYISILSGSFHKNYKRSKPQCTSDIDNSVAKRSDMGTTVVYCRTRHLAGKMFLYFIH